MFAFTVFGPDGEQVRHGQLTSQVDQPVAAGETIVGGLFLNHRLVNGVPVEYTPEQAETKRNRPLHPSRWDSTSLTWVDTRSLADIKAQRWDSIKAERERRMVLPITVAGVTLDADAKARENLMGAVLEMQATGRGHRRWTLADNSRSNLSLAQLVAIGSAIADRTEALQNLSQDLREQIDAATTPEEVAAVVWPEGN